VKKLNLCPVAPPKTLHRDPLANFQTVSVGN
jgi:hypothetical protein